MNIDKVTDGKRARRLRGLDGRIRHVETLVDRAYAGMSAKQEKAIEALSSRIGANNDVVRALIAAMAKRIDDLVARVAALEARPIVTVEAPSLASMTPEEIIASAEVPEKPE